MATKKSKKKTDYTTQQKVGFGIGLTAAAVAAAGTYFLYGSSDASQNRKKVKSWMLKAKADVLEALEEAPAMTEAEYHKLIDNVSGAYSRLKDASNVDIATFKREMKSHWGDIEKMAGPAAAAATAKVMKKVSGKKTAKKTSKKTAAKKTTTKKSATKKATKKTTKKK